MVSKFYHNKAVLKDLKEEVFLWLVPSVLCKRGSRCFHATCSVMRLKRLAGLQQASGPSILSSQPRATGP